MTNRLRLLAKDKDHPDSNIEIEVEADTPDAVQAMVNQIIYLRQTVSSSPQAQSSPSP
jgi:inorganic triphosphatase YgiF